MCCGSDSVDAFGSLGGRDKGRCYKGKKGAFVQRGILHVQGTQRNDKESIKVQREFRGDYGIS